METDPVTNEKPPPSPGEEPLPPDTDDTIPDIPGAHHPNIADPSRPEPGAEMNPDFEGVWDDNWEGSN